MSANAAGPVIQSAVVENSTGRTITLRFDDLTGSLSRPPTTDFTISGSTQGPIRINNVNRLSSQIIISTADIVAINQTISLTYVPTTNIPRNTANEPLEGFTTTVTHLGNVAPVFIFEELMTSSNNLNRIYIGLDISVTCTLTASNFQVKVNGSNRAVSSVQGCSGIYIYLSSPIVANDSVMLSYIPSSGSITNAFGVPAAAFTDARVVGVPDTIAPVVTVQSSSTHPFGQGGTIALSANEPVYWGITTDLTLSFQISGSQLLVSSILPAGTYAVGVVATDDAGNTTTRNVTVRITAASATPSPTPSPTPTPTVTATPVPTPTAPSVTKPVQYKSCATLNKKYLGGIARSYSSRNKGAGMNYIARVDAALYKANIKLDKDKDGIVCER